MKIAAWNSHARPAEKTTNRCAPFSSGWPEQPAGAQILVFILSTALMRSPMPAFT
mgnify:FL=1